MDEGAEFALGVDEEGVVRVVGPSDGELVVTAGELARLLTAILEVMMTEGDGEGVKVVMGWRQGGRGHGKDDGTGGEAEYE